MNPALTEALKEAYASAPAAKTIINTLEIRQEGVQDTIYLAQSRISVTAFDENGVERVFEPSGFQFALPPSSKEGFQSLNLSMMNINRRVSDFLRIAKSEPVAVKVIYRPYLSDDLSEPQMNPPLVLFLKDAQATSYEVAGRATFLDVVNKRAPSELYTRERFPALG
jgi:hypothetical protein